MPVWICIHRSSAIADAHGEAGNMSRHTLGGFSFSAGMQARGRTRG